MRARGVYARYVPTCTRCGRDSGGDFAFCPHCGAQLAGRTPARELRKTVTVLFCDVAGSTSLGESVDPEALRAILVRYERIKGIVERHGGTVEKFVGDAVMAVFGVPCCTRTTHCARCGRRPTSWRRSPSSASRRGSASTPARW